MDSSSQPLADAMEALNFASIHKPYISFTNLEVGEHKIYKWSYYSTIYGTRIRIDVENGYMLLPVRFATMADNVLNDLNKKQKPIIMVYAGRGKDGNKLQLTFREDSAEKEAAAVTTEN